MALAGEKESNRVWVTYERVHSDAIRMAEAMQQRTPGGIVMVAVGRGGWLPTRIAASYFEENSMPNESLGVNVSYLDAGTAEEHAVVTQGLDTPTLERIQRMLAAGSSLWVIDAICHTGRAAQAAKDYLERSLASISSGGDEVVHFGALHATQYADSSEAPWRLTKALIPDSVGYTIAMDTKPHVEYPWEYSSLEQFYNEAKTIGGLVL